MPDAFEKSNEDDQEKFPAKSAEIPRVNFAWNSCAL